MEQQQHRPHTFQDGWSYTRFVKENPIAARTLESLLQYSGFFAPARFADRDLSIESGYALSSLAALAHDQILLQGRGNLDERRGGGGASSLRGVDHEDLHSVGSESGLSTHFDTKRRDKPSSMTVVAERMRVALAIIAHVQVVAEKLAGQHGGPRRRRQAITYLEALKALSRLMLLACTKEMVIGGGAYVSGGKKKSPPRSDKKKAVDGSGPWREIDLSGVRSQGPRSFQCGAAADQANDDCTDSPAPCPPEVYTGKRSGVKLIVPPRASVVWSGRGRSNRSIGVGRAASAASPPSCDASRCSRRISGSACSVCRSRNGTAESRGLGYGVGRREMEAGHSTGSEVSCPDAQWRQRQQARENKDGGGGVSQAWLMAGEVIHILRPLVYSYSCGSAGERSWRPWLTSLGMDAAAYACTARAGGGGMVSLLAVGASSGGAGCAGGVQVLPYLNEEQAVELRRRKMLWLLYLMRSPAFELLAEPVTRGAAGVFEGVPVLSGMVGYALNMLLYVQRHHFYTSAS